MKTYRISLDSPPESRSSSSSTTGTTRSGSRTQQLLQLPRTQQTIQTGTRSASRRGLQPVRSATPGMTTPGGRRKATSSTSRFEKGASFEQQQQQSQSQSQSQSQRTRRKQNVRSGVLGLVKAVRVAVRVRKGDVEVRPLGQETEDRRRQKREAGEGITVDGQNNRIGTPLQDFFFDRVVSGEEDTLSLYHSVVHPLVDDIICGRSSKGTVLAYGQTGSGKTFTMGILSQLHLSGRDQSFGVIPLALKHVFNSTHAAQILPLRVSFCQIYIDSVYDLLDPLSGCCNGSDQDIDSKLPPFTTNFHSKQQSINSAIGMSLSIREDPSKGFYVDGLVENEVRSFEEFAELINSGLANRTMASTWMNNTSSRSHTILTVRFTNGSNGKLTFVDLAGSERLPGEILDPQRLEEAKSINASLSALGNVVSSLADPKSRHIPFRDSKLTRLLQDSLSGETVLIATISAEKRDSRETLSTLLFAERCMKVEFIAQQHRKLSKQNQEKEQSSQKRKQLSRRRSFDMDMLHTGDLEDDDSFSESEGKRDHHHAIVASNKIRSLENRLERTCEILNELYLAGKREPVNTLQLDSSTMGDGFYERLEEIKRHLLIWIRPPSSTNTTSNSAMMTPSTAAPALMKEALEESYHQDEVLPSSSQLDDFLQNLAR